MGLVRGRGDDLPVFVNKPVALVPLPLRVYAVRDRERKEIEDSNEKKEEEPEDSSDKNE